jgi:hypothetical protein
MSRALGIPGTSLVEGVTFAFGVTKRPDILSGLLARPLHVRY